MRRCAFALVIAAAAACSGTEPDTERLETSASVSFATLGRTQQVAAAVMLGQDTVTGRTFLWTSSDSTVASVTSSGLVTARKPGTATLTVTSGTLTATVPATVALVVASMRKMQGDEQWGNDGQPLPSQIWVELRDSADNYAAGAVVQYTVSGGGTVDTVSGTRVSPNGVVVWRWTVGTPAQPQTLTITSGTATPVVFTATSISAQQPGMQIDVVNVGQPFAANVAAAFASAVTFWQTALPGGTSDITGFHMAAGECGTGTPYIPSVTVDDILIFARVDSMDGPGGVLAGAGPCFIRLRSSTLWGLPLVGTMMFDIEDIATLGADGNLPSVIKHEMGHVLGFGPMWPPSMGGRTGYDCLRRPATSNTSYSDTYYACYRGLAVFDSIGGTTYTGGNKVPVENCYNIPGCGGGTANSHWRESVLGPELMTGYLNSGVANPASVLTLAQFQDLGYSVNFGAAEPYTKVFAAPSAVGGRGLLDLGNDSYQGPVWGVVESGGRMRAAQRIR